MYAIKLNIDESVTPKIWCPKKDLGMFFMSDADLAYRISLGHSEKYYLGFWGAKKSARRIWEDLTLLKKSLQILGVWRYKSGGYSRYLIVNLLTNEETPLDDFLKMPDIS